MSLTSAFSDRTETQQNAATEGQNPLEAEAALLLAAADQFHEIALSLDSIGSSDAALHLHSAASVLDQSLPKKQGWWSAPFNSQLGRRQLFMRMLDAIQPAAIIETGTFRGTTTAFMAKNFDGAIFTCELDPRWYLTAQADLTSFANVQIRRQDSRDFLKDVLADAKGDPLLFYLDAHWREDLPLKGELEIILSSDRTAAIIIDDFAVPFDLEYGFDDYGPGKTLAVELLAEVDPKGATLFFPTLPAREETGPRRGCAVIGVGRAASQLNDLAELRRYDWPILKPSTIVTKSKVAPSAKFRHECEAFRTSASWRMTAPLREIGRLLAR